MNRQIRSLLLPEVSTAFAAALVLLGTISCDVRNSSESNTQRASANVSAQCPAVELTTGLREPLGITQSNQGSLIVAETGTSTPNSGRISLIDPNGARRTLLDGLPSGLNDVNEPSGPSGVFMSGRTLYVAIGVGDAVAPGPAPGTTAVNPNPPSSPLFSSVLAIHFSADAEKITEGFTLVAADQQTLAGGGEVTLSNGAGDKVTLNLVANILPDFVPNPLPFFAANVAASNPFDLVAVGNQLYVTDGGRNSIWQVDLATGAFSILVTFPPIANPLFNPTPPPPSIGGPTLDAVPTGIRWVDGQLLTALFRGAPFPPGVSAIEQVDPGSGAHVPLISGLKTAIDVIALREGPDTDYLVLQHSSGVAPFFGSPGQLLRFETPDDAPMILADCLTRPTSMTLDEKSGTVYISEFAGRLLSVPLVP
jgi:hypothetical protein